MSDFDTTDTQSELDALKARAEMLGVKFHPSISLEKLREKVNAAIESAPEEESAAAPAARTLDKAKLLADATKLVRIRLTCMNPAKKDYEGEIFSVGNALVGTIRKYIPFNAEDGWHVPHMMYEALRDRECQIFTTRRDDKGNSVPSSKMIKEFAIEVLPPLTKEELAELARRQAMAAGQTV